MILQREYREGGSRVWRDYLKDGRVVQSPVNIDKWKHFEFAKMPIGVLTLGDTKVKTSCNDPFLGSDAFRGCSLDQHFRSLSLAQLRHR